LTSFNSKNTLGKKQNTFEYKIVTKHKAEYSKNKLRLVEKGTVASYFTKAIKLGHFCSN